MAVSIRSYDPAAFSAEVVTIPWDILGILYEVDDKVETFNTCLVNFGQTCFC